jgi:ATP/maltotriose-dependent transcriptional regulator MalT
MARLAGSLPQTQDREAYAALMTYLSSLPPGDELRRVAELLGLLSLLGQRLPDALAAAITELRELTERAGDYYGEIDARLAALPAEIAAGVDVSKVARDMGELFRQQLSGMGFETSAVLLRSTAAEMTALAGHLSTSLKPIAQDFETVAGSIADGFSTLSVHSRCLESHGSQSAESERPQSWRSCFILILAVFLAGGICGVVFEKAQTADVLERLSTQIHCAQPVVSK